MAVKVTATVEGIDKIREAVKKGGERWVAALGASLYQEGLRVMARTIPVTPWQTGRMRKSNYVAPPRGDEMIVELGFGVRYALPVHERLDARHKAPTKAKYLSDTFDSMRMGMLRSIAQRTKRNYVRNIGVGSVGSTGTPHAPNDTGD